MDEILTTKLSEVIELIQYKIKMEKSSVTYPISLQKNELFRLAVSFRSNIAFREKILPGYSPCSPFWSMMIEMYIMQSQNTKISVTDIASMTNMPLTTVLRHIDLLKKDDLICRDRDAKDSRRFWLYLTEKGFLSVEEMLQQFYNELQQNT
ncbi:hypothetical protein IP81_01585 [Novosphingobium sp. AAP83]|uniref:MarR family winged helix-turn-helix transcriptional regulator n=1 Tax=Novosphingobium sp. AAP83 TaxID=1523425 RepID=UPI0006B8ABCD|nr:winged helix-turn-helix transcriptional regulator [Novosphingobium sp. AAP83]KPF93855.1 hypothetical protein IP81_01585 [Novosphingobium sp. AAP83]